MKLKRIPDTQTETALDLEDETAGTHGEKLSPVDHEEDAVENVLIPHEVFTRSWRSSVVKTGSEPGIRFPDSLLREIGGLTNCRVELEADGGTITVRAENMRDVEEAILRIEVIDNWAVSLILRHLSAAI